MLGSHDVANQLWRPFNCGVRMLRTPAWAMLVQAWTTDCGQNSKIHRASAHRGKNLAARRRAAALRPSPARTASVYGNAISSRQDEVCTRTCKDHAGVTTMTVPCVPRDADRHTAGIDRGLCTRGLCATGSYATGRPGPRQPVPAASARTTGRSGGSLRRGAACNRRGEACNQGARRAQFRCRDDQRCAAERSARRRRRIRAKSSGWRRAPARSVERSVSPPDQCSAASLVSRKSRNTATRLELRSSSG
jgi:hypothetical protein